MGIQASSIGQSIKIINKMIDWKLSEDENVEKTEEDLADPSKNRCKIFLGYTSACISSGLRETIRYLCQWKMIDVIVTPVTGIDEDLMKCFGSHEITGFTKDNEKSKQEHKIGNINVPQKSMDLYESWLTEQIKKMHQDQISSGEIYSPAKMVKYLGKEIDDPKSIYYWCYKNNIDVYSPALTDGFFGDVLYKYNKKNPGFKVDIAQDVRGLNRSALQSKHTGCIILGGGLIKHHIMNANLMRNGTDYAVFVNTGNEFDCSDSGAKPQEALSWGKLRLDCDFAKVYAEATMVFPILVSQTFAKNKDKASKLN